METAWVFGLLVNVPSFCILLAQTLVLIVITAYVTCLGIALIGAPLVFSMAHKGYGTGPRVIFASVLISLLLLATLRFFVGLGLSWGWQRTVQPCLPRAIAS